MGPVAERVLAAARATGLLEHGRPVVVLLSGGRDSTCLLDVALRLAGQEATTALHVDYGLRPESGADARHCAALCDELGVALHQHRAGPPPERGNLQAWARALRYTRARTLARERAADVAVGHTLSDQAETVLYRLAASPGRRALLGMAPRDGGVVRPLLGVTREDTAAYCAERGLAWREDASNADPVYARSRVRHDLLAGLRSLHPAAEANVSGTAALLREEAEVLDLVVDTVLAGRDRVPVDHLRALPAAVARLVVRRLAEDATGALCPRAAARLDDLLALDVGALDLGDGARAVVEDGELRCDRTPPLPVGRA